MSFSAPSSNTLSRADSLAPAMLGAALMIGWGVALPLWMPKNGDPAVIAEAAARLSRLPLTLGEWDGTTVAADDQQIEAAGAAGVLTRRYRHRTTGTTVTALLLCGAPRPVSVHPPTACYRGLGYEPESPPKLVSLAEASDQGDSTEAAMSEARNIAQFQSAIFRRPSSSTLIDDDRIELLWSWSDDGQWTIPHSPRLTFARAPVLYKLYIAREAIADDSALRASSEEELQAFAALLVSELQRTVIVRPDQESQVRVSSDDVPTEASH